MKAKVVSQYAGTSSHFDVINKLLKEDYKRFRVLVAYVSTDGINLLYDDIVNFLDRGGKIEWIVGIDNAITSKATLEKLMQLEKAYPANVKILLFSAGNDYDLYHPKIYWFDDNNSNSIVIGSANLTGGGLLQNFEASVVLHFDAAIAEDKTAIAEFEELWKSYITPQPPMDALNIRPLSQQTIDTYPSMAAKIKQRIRKVMSRLKHPFADADKHKEIAKAIKEKYGDLLRRRSNPVPKPMKKQTTTLPKSNILAGSSSGNNLIMDIMGETRRTQMQIPRGALPFFGIKSLSKSRTINLTYAPKGSKPITKARPFIYQDNDTFRIEIAAIKNLPRGKIPDAPIIKFTHLGGDDYEYEIIEPLNTQHHSLTSLLATSGKQTNPKSRRWILV
jgi:HKD family nuclease